MKRRQFIQVAMGSAAFIGLAPKLAFASEGPTLDAIKERGSLRIGVFNGTAPYYHKDLATGEWDGFCVSMGKDFAEYLGVKLDLVETTWGNAMMDLQGNKIDVMFGLSNNPERAKVVDFSSKMMDNTFTVVTGKDNEFTNWEDLNKPEVRVAVDLGSTQDQFARRVLPNCTLVALKGADETIMALQSGRADAIIQVALLAVVTVRNLAGRAKLIVPQPQDSQPTTIGVRRDPNGEFVKFVDKWLELRRSEGKVNDWIINSLELVGVKKDTLPDTLKF
jgi:polar amino acid transport system substrate-binding protein